MPKTTKKTTSKRTQVKDLPKAKQKLSKKAMSNVKGGLRQKKQVTKIPWD